MKVTRFARNLVLLNCAVPVALLGWDALTGELGANPVNSAIRTTGLLSLIFLVLTLLVTPIIRLSGWSWLGQFRRMLGLFAFFHAALHFFLFYWFDRQADAESTVTEILKRPYLMVGTLSLMMMVPLAVTSTDGMIRLLGGRRWKGIHRLMYPIAIAGALHYYMLVKADVTQPLAFAAVIATLLAYRVVLTISKLRWFTKSAVAGPASIATPMRPKTWSGQMRVARIFEETPEVRTFRLVPTSGVFLPFDFLPGQYLNIAISVDGGTIRRSYTIASPPTRIGYCEVTVKREGQGVASRHLHDSIREGSLLDISAPAGHFTFTGAEFGSIVLIAAGVGITPLMAKIRYLTDVGWPGEIFLIYAAKSEADIIFRDEIEFLRNRFPNIQATITLTRQDANDWTGERGRFTSEMIQKIVPRIASRRVHVCGPDAMMEDTVTMLRSLGVAEENIKLESFVTPSRQDTNGIAADVANDPIELDGEPSITFTRSGKSRPMAKGETVLEASEALGVDLPYDCRAGICGTCKSRLISGHVAMDVQDALDAIDRANHVILSCQARCLDRVLIEA